MSLFYQFEKLCAKLRHSDLLKTLTPLWDAVRPVYNGIVNIAGGSGLVRNINGTDTLRITPGCRGIRESYEPKVWATVMQHIGPGSRVIDVGSHFGLYAVAFGLRVGVTGCVLAAEPDPENLELLRQHIELNRLTEIVRVVPAGMADAPGTASLNMNSLQSHVAREGGSVSIQLETLDRVTACQRWDLLLIDVEGFEEKVLRGGSLLLSDADRRPSMIMIEVHPYAWTDVGTSSATLLEALTSKGYTVRSLDGAPVCEITAYGHVVATLL